jgi:hypothetical protein
MARSCPFPVGKASRLIFPTKADHAPDLDFKRISTKTAAGIIYYRQ